MYKKLLIWNREFDLRVVFDSYDEEVLSIQEQALEAFLKAENTIQESKKQLEKYILNDEYAEIRISIYLERPKHARLRSSAIIVLMKNMV